MAYFIYKVKDENGRDMYGVMEASDRRQVRQRLTASSFFLVSAHRYNIEDLFRSKIPLTVLIMFTHRLTSLIEAGVPLLRVFTILWRQSEEKTVQLVVSYVRSRLEEGDKISTTFENFPNIFPTLYLALIRVGETSGILVAVLRKLTEYLEYKALTISRLKRALLYPSIVIVFSIFVVISMFVFVVPTFEKILLRLNTELPFLTHAVLVTSNIIRSWAFVIFIFLLGIAIYCIYKLIRSNPQMHYYWDSIIIKVPYFGHILSTVSMSQFTRSFGILLGAGVPILESFDVACVTANNRKIISEITKVRRQIETGTTLYDAFRRSKYFPVMLIEMIGVGESSGLIVPVLEKVTKHFDEETDYHLNKFITLLEPLLLIVVGFIVIMVLLAVYLPVISIWQGIMNK